MRKVKIINTDGFFGRDGKEDFQKIGLKVGDEIVVKSFVNNAVIYQPIPKGKVFFLYTWNVEDV